KSTFVAARQRISEVAETVPGRFLTPAGFRPHPKWKWPRGSVVVGRSRGGVDVVIDSRTFSTHLHLVGASGYGKSKLLEGIARQIILALDGQPRSLVLLDPHGVVIEAILRWIATYEIDRYRTIHVIDPASDNI